MSSTSSSATTGRARSCTGCRQVKLACDARKTAPQPCSRCRTKRLQCKFDSNFKRIPMRRVAQEITNGIHKLVPVSSASATTVSAPSETTTGSESHTSPPITLGLGDEAANLNLANIQVPLQTYPGRQVWLKVAHNDYYVNYSLGNVALDAETVISLLQHFERHHLPHALFLANIESLYALAVKSPLLFWTIVLVATREHDSHGGLYEQICVAHGVLLSQVTQIAIHSIEEIHALLVLCLWPIPKHRQHHDPAWNYIGLATNAAMQLNCHRPIPTDSILSTWRGMMDQTAAEIGPGSSALTWIYCFEIGVRLSAAQGLPPPLATTSQLQSVAVAISSVSLILTDEQKLITEVLRLSALSTSEIDATEDPQIRYSLIQMFDNQFTSLQQSNHRIWTTELEIELMASKLYMYALMLTLPTHLMGTHQQHQANQQLILLRLQDAASKLITRMMQLSNTSVDDGFYPAGTLSFYPKHYFTSLYLAGISLFRFLASYKGASQQDTDIVVKGLTEAHKIFQSFPEQRDAMRAAVNIQFLVDIVRRPDLDHPFPLSDLVIKNRLGASVVYDAVFRATHHRNRHPVTGGSVPVSSWLLMNEDPRLHLPMTPEEKYGHSSSGQSTEDSLSQSQGKLTGPWAPWDNYINDFEVSFDSWNNDVQTQVDALTRAQMYEAASASMMPISGDQPYAA